MTSRAPDAPDAPGAPGAMRTPGAPGAPGAQDVGDPAMARYLIIPGWAGSGPDHWQSHWERELPGAARVAMADWDLPRRADWVKTLDEAVRASAEPPLLIAHSLGCVAVAHWAAEAAARARRAVRGALLVAPADLDRETAPPVLFEFRPVPRAPLPFPAHVVASDDDPYVSLERARQIAADWGGGLTILRAAGHINSASGYGPWREGRALLRHFGDGVDVEHAAEGAAGPSQCGGEAPGGHRRGPAGHG
jgi:hypothetical protein